VIHARTQHPNARLTPRHRLTMVAFVVEKGWTIEATAERFQVDAKTVRKWRDRFIAEGEAGLQDRSSRPRRSPNRTPRSCRRRVIRLRTKHRWGADQFAHETSLAASTVQGILNAEGVGRLDRGDRASEPVLRYQFDEPGGMIPVDVKKISGILAGGGWRIHDAAATTTSASSRPATATSTRRSTTAPASSLLRDPPRRASCKRRRVLGPRLNMVRNLGDPLRPGPH
jgi:transposase-like protein